MTHILFVVDMPVPGLSSVDIDGPTRWFDFQLSVDKIALPEGATRLPCKNVWLFPAEGSDQERRTLQSSADAQKLTHASFLILGEVAQL